jgi:Rad3-related DNA helicase
MENNFNQINDVDKYFRMMVEISEKTITGYLNLLSSSNSMAKAIETLTKEIEKNEEILTDISYKMKTISNEQLKEELQKTKDLISVIQNTTQKTLEEFKEHRFKNIDGDIKEKVVELLGKISNFDGKLKAIEEKDKKLDTFMKLIGIGLTLFMLAFGAASTIMQSNNSSKIEKAILSMEAEKSLNYVEGDKERKDRIDRFYDRRTKENK